VIHPPMMTTSERYRNTCKELDLFANFCCRFQLQVSASGLYGGANAGEPPMAKKLPHLRLVKGKTPSPKAPNYYDRVCEVGAMRREIDFNHRKQVIAVLKSLRRHYNAQIKPLAAKCTKAELEHEFFQKVCESNLPLRPDINHLLKNTADSCEDLRSSLSMLEGAYDPAEARVSVIASVDGSPVSLQDCFEGIKKVAEDIECDLEQINGEYV
jgi:hypothetical protein